LIFAAQHGIAPMIEVIRADKVDEAYERVRRSDVRYRFVITVVSLPVYLKNKKNPYCSKGSVDDNVTDAGFLYVGG
jgi:hypothetical protein